MIGNSVGPGWGGQSYPWTYPYVGDYPPNRLPQVTRPDTKPFDFSGIFSQQPSRDKIERELLQKIAHELHGFVDDKGYDWQSILDWVDEIIEEYYVKGEKNDGA